MIINYPSNPTGGVMTEADYREIVPIIQESGIYVVSDEIYAELSFDQAFASLSQFEEVRDQILVINGFSKAYAMTGWRLGYILANPTITKALTKIHQYVIMSASTPAQYAAIEALRNGYDDVILMREEYLNRRNLLVNSLNRMGLNTPMPHGTFYVFADIRPYGLSSEEFCNELLNQEKVACVPGDAFGPHGQGFIRISYAYSLNHIKEACVRIEHFLQQFK